jgi:hypothetical protein
LATAIPPIAPAPFDAEIPAEVCPDVALETAAVTPCAGGLAQMASPKGL